MKRRYKILVPTIIILLIIIGILIHNFVTQFTSDIPIYENEEITSQEQINGTELVGTEKEIEVTSKAGVTMYIDPTTTNVILRDADGNDIAQTLPGFDYDEISQSETVSPISVNYKTDNISTPEKMYGYDESILKNNYLIDILDDSVKVTYMLGGGGINESVIPRYIDADMYENQIIPSITEKEASLLKVYYEYSESVDAYARFGTMNPNKISDIYTILYTNAGYTKEDLEASNKKYDVSEEETAAETVGFVVPLIYGLDDDGNLTVNIPLNEVTATGVNQLISIDVLPGFMSTAKGHFLVPDGSGAIIDTTTPKTTKVYSKDFTNIDSEIVGNYDDVITKNLTLPLFANDNTIAYIDNGAEATTLNVELIGKQKLIYPSINMQYSSFFSFSDDIANSGINLASAMTDGTYAITYQVNEKNQSYYDYVNSTKAYFSNKFDLTSFTSNPKMYLYALGAFDYTDYFAGVPYTAIDTLTTAEDLQAMLDNLGAVDNIQIIYDGWNQNGFSSSILDTQICSENGDVESFIEANPNTSLAINMARIQDEFAKGYNMKVDTAYGVDGKVAKHQKILNSSFLEDANSSDYYYLSPKYLLSAVQKFMDGFDNAPSLFIKDLSHIGYASFNGGSLALPLESEDVVSEAFTMLSEAGYELGMNNPILDRGFMADYIVGLPTVSSENTIFDYSIPFTQLVYSGLIDQANTSINLSTDGSIRSEVLHAFETKSSIMFTVSGESPSKLKDTEYNDKYSSDFNYWLETINKVNSEYQTFISTIGNAQITDDVIDDTGASIVSYDNGMQIAFNYGDVNVNVKGQAVPALSYVVLEGE